MSGGGGRSKDEGRNETRPMSKAHQQEVAVEARLLAMNLYNEQRKRERRLDRARSLNDADLI